MPSVSIFNTPIQRIRPDDRRTYITYSEASKGLQRCAPQHGYSDYLDSAGALYQCSYFDKKHESLLCSVGHFSGSDFEFCSPYLPEKSRYNLAIVSVHVRRYTLSYGETREIRTCSPHEKIDLSGRSRTVQIARPENTQQFRAIVERQKFHSLPLG